MDPFFGTNATLMIMAQGGGRGLSGQIVRVQTTLLPPSRFHTVHLAPTRLPHRTAIPRGHTVDDAAPRPNQRPRAYAGC